MQPLGAWSRPGVSYLRAARRSRASREPDDRPQRRGGRLPFSAGDTNAAVLISYAYIPTAGGAGLPLAAVKGTPTQGRIRSPTDLCLLAGRRGPRVHLLRLCAQDSRRRRSNWRPGAFAPPSASAHVEVDGRSGDDRLRHEPMPAPVRAMLQPLRAVGMFALGLDAWRTQARASRPTRALTAALSARRPSLLSARRHGQERQALRRRIERAIRGAARFDRLKRLDGRGRRRCFGRLRRRREISANLGIRREDQRARDPARQGSGARSWSAACGR